MLSIDKNQVMIEHFKEITLVTSSCIKINMKSYSLMIEGKDLHVLALGKDEFLVEGTLQNLAFVYEK